MSNDNNTEPRRDSDTVHELVGHRFEAKRGFTRYEWEVITEPVYPTYGGDHQFVWARPLRTLPGLRGRKRKHAACMNNQVFFLPLPNASLDRPAASAGTVGGVVGRND